MYLDTVDTLIIFAFYTALKFLPLQKLLSIFFFISTRRFETDSVVVFGQRIRRRGIVRRDSLTLKRPMHAQNSPNFRQLMNGDRDIDMSVEETDVRAFI